LDSSGLTISFTASGYPLPATLQVGLIDTEQIGFSLNAASQSAFKTFIDGPVLPPSWQMLEQGHEQIKVVAGELRLELTTGPFHLQISRGENILLTTSSTPAWLASSASESPTAVRMAFDSPATESFHGLGALQRL
jgi:hypothetical protein